MSNYCVDCGSPIPEDQGSRICSMCYGDVDHGKDGYYRQWMQEQIEEEYRQQESEALALEERLTRDYGGIYTEGILSGSELLQQEQEYKEYQEQTKNDR